MGNPGKLLPCLTPVAKCCNVEVCASSEGEQELSWGTEEKRGKGMGRGLCRTRPAISAGIGKEVLPRPSRLDRRTIES